MNRNEVEPVEATLHQARVVFVASIATVPVLLAIGGWIDPPERLMVFPVSLIGLVSPVIGYRLYLLRRERVPTGASRTEACRAFLHAGIVALAVTQGAAILGLVGYALSGTLSALSGVLTHVLLVGAIWPAPERLESFLGREASPPADG